MKHAFLLLIAAVAGYVGWQVANPVERRHASRFITRHGLRFLALLALLALLLAAAAYLPSSSLI